MVEPTEKEIGFLNVGKRAGLALEYLGPLLEEQKEIIVSRMKSLYRDGQWSESKLVSLAAELCALDDLKNRIQSKIRKAEKISMEINREPAN